MGTHTQAGELNRRLLLQRPVKTQDDTGDPVVTWQTVGVVWGAAEPERGAEFFAAGGIVGQDVMLFRIRYRADVTRTWRVLYGGKIWNINEAQDSRDARTERWLYATAGVNEG